MQPLNIVGYIWICSFIAQAHLDFRVEHYEKIAHTYLELCFGPWWRIERGWPYYSLWWMSRRHMMNQDSAGGWRGAGLIVSVGGREGNTGRTKIPPAGREGLALLFLAGEKERSSSGTKSGNPNLIFITQSVLRKRGWRITLTIC